MTHTTTKEHAAPTPKHEALSHTIAKYASSRIYGQLLNILTTFARPKILTPEMFGLWTLLKIIPGYVVNVHMGTLVSMRFLIPFHHARNEENRVSRIRSTVLSFSLSLIVLAAFLLAWASVFDHAASHVLVALHLRVRSHQSLTQGFTLEQRMGMLCVAGMILLQFANEYLITLLRSYERFNVLGANNYIRATATFLLTIPLLYYWGIYGLFLSALLVQLLVVGHLRRKSGPVADLRFDPRTFWELLVKGLPMHLSDMGMLVLTTTGQIVISRTRWMTFADLGHYGLALIFVNFLQHLPGTTREILEPRMMRGLANTSVPEVTREYLLKPLVNMAYVFPLALGGALLTIPVVVPLILPEYVSGVAPTLTLIYGFYFLSLCEQPNALLLALNRQVRLLLVLPFPIVLNIWLTRELVHLDKGIAGVALASSVSYFTLFLIYVLLLEFSLKEKPRGWHWHLASLFVPVLLMWDMVFALTHVVPLFVANRYVACLIECAVFVPAWYWVRKIAPRFVPLLTPIGWRDFLSVLRMKSNGSESRRQNGAIHEEG